MIFIVYHIQHLCLLKEGMHEGYHSVEPTTQRGRHPSTDRLLWWLGAMGVIYVGIAVWYWVAGPHSMKAAADDLPSTTIQVETKSS